MKPRQYEGLQPKLVKTTESNRTTTRTGQAQPLGAFLRWLLATTGEHALPAWEFRGFCCWPVCSLENPAAVSPGRGQPQPRTGGQDSAESRLSAGQGPGTLQCPWAPRPPRRHCCRPEATSGCPASASLVPSHSYLKYFQAYVCSLCPVLRSCHTFPD